MAGTKKKSKNTKTTENEEKVGEKPKSVEIVPNL